MGEMERLYTDKKYNIKRRTKTRDVCLQDTKLAKINKINNTLKSAQCIPVLKY